MGLGAAVQIKYIDRLNLGCERFFYKRVGGFFAEGTHPALKDADAVGVEGAGFMQLCGLLKDFPALRTLVGHVGVSVWLFSTWELSSFSKNWTSSFNSS